MLVIGVTGSIGMGKTTATGVLRRLGLPVHDADAAVHGLFARGGAAVRPVGDAFPAAARNGAIDRKALGAAVFGNPAALARLEAIVHPLVRQVARRFLDRCRRRRASMAVLDVPLLFETGGDALCDVTILVSAPAFIQAQRVLRRPGMTRQRLADIRARQMPDAEKRRRADFVVSTGLGRRESLRQIHHIVRLLRDGKRAAARHDGAPARRKRR